MDLSRLSRGEQIAAASGALLFIFMFFNWFGVSLETGFGDFGGGKVNAWDSLELIRFVLLATAVAAVGFALLKASGNDLTLPMPVPTIVTLLGGLSVLLILYRLIDPPGGGVDIEGVGISRQIGIFLGLIAAVGVTYGGYTAMEEEGASFQDVADSFSSGPGGPPSGGGQAPPPPPSGQ